MGLGHQTHDEDGVPHDAEHEVQVSKRYTVPGFGYSKHKPYAKRQDWQSYADIYDGRNRAKPSKSKEKKVKPSSKVCLKSSAKKSSMLT